MSGEKLPKKETICEMSMLTAPTVMDLPLPFVAMSNDHIESLKQISSTLQPTLETTNQVYRWQSKNVDFTPSANSSVARKGSERVVGKDGDLSVA